MRVTFPRLADHQRGYAVVERDDGVVYRMDGFTVMGPELPHDVRHLIVERELRVSDGICGSHRGRHRLDEHASPAGTAPAALGGPVGRS